jgi:hypothetical protein
MPQPNERQEPFVERRNYSPSQNTPGFERRQFTNSHSELTPHARELALAVDQYKLEHRRRFVTYEEIMEIVLGLGYEKASAPVHV